MMDTGTVTFLFTDIEGSTRLWELYPEAMKAVLARHDALLRRAVESNQGQVVKTTGDGCHAAFEAAAAAIAAALAAQRSLAADPWEEIRPHTLRVRMGVHTGEAEARAGDYFGPALNRAARLMSVGQGGQVLVSTATAELVRDILPDGTRLLDLGDHRLKDLVRPEHIFQLAHPLLKSAFPPLHTLDAYPNNLPVQLTSFIGREVEIGEARQLLSAGRLVTLTGSGGTGKTRLALQAAAELLPDFVDGAWLVELAPLTDQGLILQAIAGVFELNGIPGIPLIDLVSDYLRHKHLLLILDNCEHLIDACAQLANQLLRTCPGLKILASSREGLGIAGEVSYRVPSLTLPSLERLNPAAVTQSEAVQLFLERARAVNPHFVLTASNTPAVAQICQRLDGIPLALELAAARIRLFSAEQIAAHLNDRFRLLTGGSRTALPRQQTLRALIDWSYDLLSDAERALLRRLSVFVGGWTFEAADALSTDLDVLSLLEQLVNKSLVVMEEVRGQARYHLLETIRQYARDRLVESGEGVIWRDRHLDYFLKLSEEAAPGLIGSQAFEWIERLELEYDNIHAATVWGQEGRPVDALILVGNLMFFWPFRVDRLQALDLLRTLLGHLGELPADGTDLNRVKRAKARTLTCIGLLTMGVGDNPTSSATMKQAIALERQLGDRFWLAFALGIYGNLGFFSGDLQEARSAAQESIAIFRELGERRWLLVGMPALAGIEARLGNQQAGQQLIAEMRRNLNQVDHPMFMPTLLGIGMQAYRQGSFEDARLFFLEGLKISRRVKSVYFEATLQSELAHLLRQSGDFAQAKQAYRELILRWKNFGHYAAVAHQMECFGFIARAENEGDRAAHLLGAAEVLRENIHIPMADFERPEYAQQVGALRDLMTPDVMTAAWAEGRAMEMDQAVAYAIAPMAEGLAAGVK